MTVTPYEAEDILQALLETDPDLMAGGQMTPEAPRRWCAVSTVGRTGRIRVQVERRPPVRGPERRPTLVEVKRSTDTRIRREVVGQMLDYAAHGVR